MAGCLKWQLGYTWQSYNKWQKLLTDWHDLHINGMNCLQKATVAYKWQQLLTVAKRSRQRQLLIIKADYKRENMRSHIATGAYTIHLAATAYK
jgi:hypothetical protein